MSNKICSKKQEIEKFLEELKNIIKYINIIKF